MVTNEQFGRSRRLALSVVGIELVERHRELLERRSRRASIDDCAGMESLPDRAEAGEKPATQQLVGRMDCSCSIRPSSSAKQTASSRAALKAFVHSGAISAARVPAVSL
jgi:hypothetical protein